jgi:hypothetical protein
MKLSEWLSVRPGVILEGECAGAYRKWVVKATVEMNGPFYATGIGDFGTPFIWSRGWVESNCDSIWFPIENQVIKIVKESNSEVAA